MNKKILIILIIAFLVRLISLNQSLWLDEATTAKVVQTFSYTDIVTKFSPFDFHPPLYYLFMKSWASLVGYSEVALRLSSVFFSLLTGFLVFKIGKLLKNQDAGFWSMLFFLFNPLIVYYSQEARMYMMATFLLTISLYYFIKLLRVDELTSLNLFLFNLFCIVSFYTFYGSIFLIASFIVYFFLKKQYRLFLFSTLPFLFSVLFISPLLYTQLIHARQSLQIVMNWKQVLGTATIKNLFLIPLKFSIGRISFEPKILYYLISGLWTLFIFYFVVKGSKKNKLLGYLFIWPLLIGFLFSFFTPLLKYFRFLYLIPVFSFLLATSAKRALYLILLGFSILSCMYLLLPQFQREDWKSVATSLVNNHTVYMILNSSDPLRYYAPMLPLKELRTLEGIELEKEVTIIPYTADIYGFDYRKALLQRGFTYKETKKFRGLWYEIWVKNKNYAGSFLYSPTEI